MATAAQRHRENHGLLLRKGTISCRANAMARAQPPTFRSSGRLPDEPLNVGRYAGDASIRARGSQALRSRFGIRLMPGCRSAYRVSYTKGGDELTRARRRLPAFRPPVARATLRPPRARCLVQSRRAAARVRDRRRRVLGYLLRRRDDPSVEAPLRARRAARRLRRQRRFPRGIRRAPIEPQQEMARRVEARARPRRSRRPAGPRGGTASRTASCSSACDRSATARSRRHAG